MRRPTAPEGQGLAPSERPGQDLFVAYFLLLPPVAGPVWSANRPVFRGLAVLVCQGGSDGRSLQVGTTEPPQTDVHVFNGITRPDPPAVHTVLLAAAEPT